MILGTHLSFYKLIKDLKVRPKTTYFKGLAQAKISSTLITEEIKATISK